MNSYFGWTEPSGSDVPGAYQSATHRNYYPGLAYYPTSTPPQQAASHPNLGSLSGGVGTVGVYHNPPSVPEISDSDSDQKYGSPSDPNRSSAGSTGMNLSSRSDGREDCLPPTPQRESGANPDLVGASGGYSNCSPSAVQSTQQQPTTLDKKFSPSTQSGDKASPGLGSLALGKAELDTEPRGPPGAMASDLRRSFPPQGLDPRALEAAHSPHLGYPMGPDPLRGGYPGGSPSQPPISPYYPWMKGYAPNPAGEYRHDD
ncbi:hypothetical protein BIW11_01323 [Tropilaelaps mercedesae]|uniref:Uncharacterized protein n=1 Tax=Tropilaelaps mercedesae TaxID=418985 RepID=A0A1V9XFL2_9ACAR|nr:hypothetical protein BIW11_01323 [Tropilaelaps mercedesae]